MRIAQITPVYPPLRGGMGRVAFEYTERLRARGHDVHVVTPAIRVGNAGVVWPVTGDVTSTDIAHLHYPFYGGAEPIARARATGQIRALVVTYHMDATAAGWKGAAFDVHRETTQPWLLSRADRVLASSQDYAAASSLARLNGWQDRTIILPFGVDAARFQPGHAQDLRQSLGVDHLAVVLFVGGLDAAHRFKGLDVLVAATTKLRHSDWHLVVAGNGNDLPTYQALATSAGVAERVTFAGNVPDDDLPSFYRAADVHVLPSTSTSEAFGLVTLEAAASGVPSIVSDLPGVRTTVIDGTTGWIVPPGSPTALANALDAALSSDTERRRRGQLARARVLRDYQWPPLIAQLEDIYQSVLHAL